MKIFNTGIFLFFVSFTIFAQDVDLRNATAVDRAIGESNYYFLSKHPLRDGKSSIDEIKSKMEIELKSSLAKKIISKVKVQNKSKSVQLNINDNNDAKNNSSKEVINFEFNSDIESDLTFTEPKVVFQEDSRNNILLGIIYVAKVQFLEQNFGKIK
jgi:hypothetical protein